jgi:triphosphatase
MQFELSLEPDAAARVQRLPLLTRGRGGRARSHKTQIIWHDSVDRQLAAAGLSLARERGTWRLERMYPDHQAWPPACPPQVICEASDPALLTHPVPEQLVAIAAFDGQASDHQAITDAGPVDIRRLRGTLRTIATGQETARLILTGDEAAILAVARSLGQSVAVTAPRATLAAEAFATADGASPPARRLGAPRILGNGSIGEAFAHTLGHLTDVVLHFAPAAARGDAGPEPVHQMRVAVRRLRSAITVFRPAIGCDAVAAADTALKALANRLGPTRDWDVFVTETAPLLAAALPDEPRVTRLLNAAERQRNEYHAELDLFLTSPDCRSLGIELAWLAGARSWHDTLLPEQREILERPLRDFAAEELQRRLKKMRAAAKGIEQLDIPALHGLRLRAKRMRYAAEIFAPAFPGKTTRRFIEHLSDLQARLGVLNDGAVATHLMEELGGPGGRHGFAVGVVTGMTLAREVAIRPRIYRAWEKFLRQPAFWD